MTGVRRDVRSVLFVPGTREDRFGKALQSGADFVCLDLEDAVRDQDKDSARAKTASWVMAMNVPNRIGIRVNALSSRHWDGDGVMADVASHVGGIFLAKTETPADVEQAAEMFRAPIIALIETPTALERVYDIARAEPCAGVMLGAHDLCGVLGVSPTSNAMAYPRARIAMAAAAANIAAIDAPAIEFQDQRLVLEHALAGRQLGMTACAAIHPNQLTAIHDVATPSDKEWQQARIIIDAYDSGQDAAMGMMVDKPVVEAARTIVARYNRQTEAQKETQ